MEDLLMMSALAYKELLPYRYHFKLGFKRKLREIHLCFPQDAYHHLAGFHKVGFAQLKNRKSALDFVLAGGVTQAQFEAGGYSLEDRWLGISRLKKMIETNRMVFYYRGHETIGSSIRADYLMVDEQTTFFIIDHVPQSIFAHQDGRYETGCPRYVTLQIEREDTQTGRQTLIYRSESFQE